MKMYSKYCFFTLLFLIFACSNKEKSNKETKNITEEVLFNNSGDTVVTGKYIDLNFNEFSIDSLIVFNKFDVEEPILIQSNHEIGKIKSHFIKELHKSELISNTNNFKKANQNFELTNYKGDKIKTNEEHEINFNEKFASLPIEKSISGFSRKESDLYNFHHISSSEGLDANYRDFLVSKNSELVLASDDNGIQFLNNKTLKKYNAKNGFSNSSIYKIVELKNGNICTGSWGNGLTIFDGEKFNNLIPDNGLSSDLVTALLEDSKGNIWIGTWGGGLAKLTGNKLTHYALESGVSSLNIVSIFEDSKGRIWFGTFGGGINYFYNNEFTIINKNVGFDAKGTLAFSEDNQGAVWIGTWGKGLFKFIDNKLFEIEIPDLDWDLYISSLHFDSYSNLWIGTARNGLYKIDANKNTTRFNNTNGFSLNNVISIKEDKQKNIWFSVFGDGLYKYNENSLKTIKDYDKNIELIIGAISENKKENKVYFGSINSQGLFYIEKNSIFKFESVKLNLQITNLISKNDTILISTGGQGILSLKNKKLVQLLFKKNLNSNMINSLFVDKNNNYWIGTNDGLKIINFEKQTVKCLNENDGLSTSWVSQINQDQNGNIWIVSHGGGLSKINGNKIIHFTQKEGIKSNYVNNLYFDKENRAWIATRNGISVIENEKVMNFDELTIFDDYNISSIQQDKKNNYWISSNNGVYAFKFKSNNGSNLELFESTLFDFENGLKSYEMFNNSMHIDQNNKLWVGTGIDLIYKDLNIFEFPKKYVAPIFKKIEILGIQYLFNDSLKANNKNIWFNSRQNDLHIPNDLQLSYSYNNITFHFTSIDNIDQNKTKYSYKIDGLVENWSNPTNENKADYKNLPYGDFRFLVKSIGNNNQWSDIAEFKFTINKPLWATWWFRFLFLLLIIYLFYIVIKFRTRKLIEKQIQLEEIVDERTKELKEEKEIVEEKNREILESITYAKRIQSAILPQPKLVKEFLEDSFILYKPKDIVAGDFYWLEVVGDTVLFAAADCTGHGVPGAMVSVVCNNGLNRAVREHKLILPNEILDKTRQLVIEEFEKSDEEVKDGMDISLCALDTKTNTLKWSGANNPLWILRKGDLIEHKADKQPIGKHFDSKPFSLIEVQLEKNDIIYIFTDGYQDQFGGPKEKKFRAAQMKELFLSLTSKTMEEQRKLIDVAFEDWKGELEQVDDVCVIGVRI
jgi:ligand-binding sensor domain-containing protein/serine phosphatase RsbU (regulator of sigma subunit)